MKRTPIQVICSVIPETPLVAVNHVTMALCDDGTIWVREVQGPKHRADRATTLEWRRLPDIPQDEEPAK